MEYYMFLGMEEMAISLLSYSSTAHWLHVVLHSDTARQIEDLVLLEVLLGKEGKLHIAGLMLVLKGDADNVIPDALFPRIFLLAEAHYNTFTNRPAQSKWSHDIILRAFAEATYMSVDVSMP
jgi:hypothetical protein